MNLKKHLPLDEKRLHASKHLWADRELLRPDNNAGDLIKERQRQARYKERQRLTRCGCGWIVNRCGQIKQPQLAVSARLSGSERRQPIR